MAETGVDVTRKTFDKAINATASLKVALRNLREAYNPCIQFENFLLKNKLTTLDQSQNREKSLDDAKLTKSQALEKLRSFLTKLKEIEKQIDPTITVIKKDSDVKAYNFVHDLVFAYAKNW